VCTDVDAGQDAVGQSQQCPGTRAAAEEKGLMEDPRARTASFTDADPFAGLAKVRTLPERMETPGCPVPVDA
jgi:hypothetical protein